jgi:hypothetical protein
MVQSECPLAYFESAGDLHYGFTSFDFIMLSHTPMTFIPGAKRQPTLR